MIEAPLDRGKWEEDERRSREEEKGEREDRDCDLLVRWKQATRKIWHLARQPRLVSARLCSFPTSVPTCFFRSGRLGIDSPRNGLALRFYDWESEFRCSALSPVKWSWTNVFIDFPTAQALLLFFPSPSVFYFVCVSTFQGQRGATALLRYPYASRLELTCAPVHSLSALSFCSCHFGPSVLFFFFLSVLVKFSK